MKRKFFLKYGWTIAILFSTSSCLDEVLTKQPLDIISDAIIWDDMAMVDAYIAAQYSLSVVMVNETPEYIGNWSDGSPVTGQWSLEPSKHGYGPLIINNISDEGKGGWEVSGNAGVYKAGNINIGGGFLEWWEYPYFIIRNLNKAIEALPQSNLSADFKANRIAEARFLRAFHYFAMVKRYGGVPLITRSLQLNDPEELLYPSRNSEQEVYDYIISEMDEIAAVLGTGAGYGRPSKYTAFALKCRAALYAGSVAASGPTQLDNLLGIPVDRSAHYYQLAYNAASEIIKSNVFRLYTGDADKVVNFRNIFLKKRNSEVIFAVQHNFVSAMDAGGSTWSYDFCQRPKPHGWDIGMGNTPYLEMAEAFEYTDGRSGKLDRNAIQQGLWSMEELWGGKDPRFFATLYTMETPWRLASKAPWRNDNAGIVDFHSGLIGPDGTLYEGAQSAYNGIPAWGVQNLWGNFHTGFGVMKYLDESMPMGSMWSDSGTDYIVFRYAEILLNFAEAALELGHADEALDAINQVRSRAGVSRKSVIARDDIRQERRVELAFEGHRYWDLRRWRVATTALSREFSGLKYVLDYNSGKYRLIVLNNIDGNNKPLFHNRNYYFPITLRRTSANPNLIENPGYN